jgi:uncharacterized protein YbjT (DUF2867 family)
MSTSTSTVLVLGATGKTGRRVAALLDERGAAVRAASRSGATRFDWADRTTWGPALDGASAVYVVAPDLGTGLRPTADEIGAFVGQAAAAGVGRAVLLSVPDGGAVDIGDARTAERAVLDADLDGTIVRAHWFFQNFSEDFFRDPVLRGELRVPTAQGRDGFIDADDIAAVAVAALLDDGHAGRVYELTGPRLMTFGDAAAEIARAAGRELRHVPVSADVFAQESRDQGWPEEAIGSFAALYAKLADDELATLTDDVRTVLGRPPRDFADYAREAAAQGAWEGAAAA